MNRIAQSGSEIGNFFYVDTSAPNYDEVVRECLLESLDIALLGQGKLKLELSSQWLDAKMTHILEPTFTYDEKQAEGADPAIQKVTLSCQEVVLTSVVEGLQAHIKAGERLNEIGMTREKVSDPRADVLLRARLISTNKRIFDLIQRIQVASLDERPGIFTEL